MANPLVATSSFVRKYTPTSANSVNSAAKGLLTCNRGEYQVYDLFLDIWIRNRYLK